MIRTKQDLKEYIFEDKRANCLDWKWLFKW